MPPLNWTNCVFFLKILHMDKKFSTGTACDKYKVSEGKGGLESLKGWTELSPWSFGYQHNDLMTMFTEIMLIGVDVDDFLSKVWRPKQSPLPSWLSPDDTLLCALNNVSPDDTLLCAAALNNALNEWLWSYLRMQLSNSPVSAHHRLTSGARGDTTLKGVLKAVSEGGITMQVRFRLV